LRGVIHPVILSGGAGTRLWPMSRTLRPKQLLPLTSDHSMLQETVLRVSGPQFGAPLIVCNEQHRFIIAEQLRTLHVAPAAIVLEPEARNTAPAITAAALLLAERHGEGMMLVLPSDHVIEDLAGFLAAVEIAAAAANTGALVTFGIKPTRPETGYGYIRRGPALNGMTDCYRIDRFVEKPDSATAESYLAAGDYFWNSGMFLFPIAGFLEEASRLRPAMRDACRQAVAAAAADLDFLRLDAHSFKSVEPESVDYAIMEDTLRGAVVPADIGWNDLGSWSALWEIGARDVDGNVKLGDVITRDTRNCYVRGEEKLIAAIGVEDLVIVATDDVVLVVPRQRAQEVKSVVLALEKAGRSEHYVHTKVFRPWGWFQSIDIGPRFQVKQICVNPGHGLSTQLHYHRAEHWIVVSGTAMVMRGEETFYLTENESTYIPHHTRHSLQNPGRVPLNLIEVQTGGYLGEDDIVRYGDQYGRGFTKERA
jgi:mannose-1-phosphate guanylyltransferase/mannose-6-phosphate isomerase